jgi:TonB family protein
MRPPRLLAASLVAAALLASPTRGRAQVTSQQLAVPPPPVVTMPTVTKNVGASYPKQALDEGVDSPADVGLFLDIDANGKVTRAVVEVPAGHGFDEAAVAATQALEFEPAKRDGTPVAARIRYRFHFEPPPAVLSGRVLRLSGDRPIGGATVVARDGAGQERATATGADGDWRLEGLPAGSYHVTIRAVGMLPHEADESVKPGEEATAIDRLSPEKAAEPAPAAGAPTEVIEEVEVKGTKPPREVSKFQLDVSEINRIPGTNGDALRSLQNLPGVARPPGFAGLLIVRGSAPEDSQIFVDGTPVPIIYHFGGLSSVVPTEMLSRIDFFPGNFSSQYGRAMGGIVDVGLADPKGDKLHVMAEANLIDTRAIVQGPLFDTGWTFSLAGRRSWFDVWLGPVLQGLSAGTSVAPVYYDYQGVVQRQFNKRESVRFAFFGSDDKLDILLKSPSASEPELSGFGDHTGFWRTQALYRNHISDRTELRIVGAFGEDYVNFNAGSLLSVNLQDWPITSRVEVAERLDKRLTMNVGLDLLYEPYTVSVVAPPPPKPGQPPPGPFSSQPSLATNSSGALFQPALYTEWEATPWAGTRIIPGIRLDYTRETAAWDLSPRVVVRQDVAHNPRTTLKAGVGLFTQPPQPRETNAVFGTPGLSSNRAYQYDVGIEHEFTSQIDASVEGFYKELDNLVETGLGNTGSGLVYGGETLIRYKRDEHFFGWLAYTLSRSVRREAPGLPLQVFLYDETHVLTVLGSYRLGHGWEFGARYRLTSGYMTTPQGYGFYDENIGTYVPLQAYPPNGTRLPLFHSLDLRVDKSWKAKWGTFGMYLDVLNVYNSGNAAGTTYDYNYTHASQVNDLPILPSLGLHAEM